MNDLITNGDVALREKKFHVGSYYQVTTGLKREFRVRALDSAGEWFERLDGSRVAGRELVIVDLSPEERHTKPSVSGEGLRAT